MIRKILILCGLILSLSTAAMAQSGQGTEIRKQMQSIANKYEQKSGFDIMTAVKGEGLELIKVMMRKEFGKDFIKGVNIIIMADYAEASKSDSALFRSEVMRLKRYCENIDIPEELLKEENGVTDFMVKVDSSGEYMTDFIIIHEAGNERSMVYFGGKIKADPDLF